MMSNPDLFGTTPAQPDLFADQPSQPRKVMDFQAEARKRLTAMLAEARAAERLPWSEREAKTLEILFPQMAEWLPGDEANQLCFEFARELERLRRAA
jgi:hypothetical protein